MQVLKKKDRGKERETEGKKGTEKERSGRDMKREEREERERNSGGLLFFVSALVINFRCGSVLSAKAL